MMTRRNQLIRITQNQRQILYLFEDQAAGTGRNWRTTDEAGDVFSCDSARCLKDARKQRNRPSGIIDSAHAGVCN